MQRLCPHCNGPGFESQPGALCCVSLPLSVSYLSRAVLSIKGQNFFFQKLAVMVGTNMAGDALRSPKKKITSGVTLTNAEHSLELWSLA